MIYSFVFFNAFPETDIYCSYSSPITNQNYNTSIISYTHYERFSISLISKTLNFKIFNMNGIPIKVSTNILTEITSTTGNILALIPSINNLQADILIKLGNETMACLMYQNMAFNMNNLTIYNNDNSSNTPIISTYNRQDYSICSASNLNYIPHNIKYCSLLNNICINSTNNVSVFYFL